MIALGLYASNRARTSVFPSHVWPGAPKACEYTLVGEAWNILEWEFPIDPWPAAPAFRIALHLTMEELIRDGCRVAWASAEGFPFCDPPQLFDPKCMSGGVLAWMLDDGAFCCSLDPDLPVNPVDDEALSMLRLHATGLADQ